MGVVGPSGPQGASLDPISSAPVEGTARAEAAGTTRVERGSAAARPAPPEATRSETLTPPLVPGAPEPAWHQTSKAQAAYDFIETKLQTGLTDWAVTNLETQAMLDALDTLDGPDFAVVCMRLMDRIDSSGKTLFRKLVVRGLGDSQPLMERFAEMSRARFPREIHLQFMGTLAKATLE